MLHAGEAGAKVGGIEPAFLARGRQPFAIGAERDAGYADFVRGKCPQQTPGLDVPDADVWSIVVAGAGYP